MANFAGGRCVAEIGKLQGALYAGTETALRDLLSAMQR